MKKQNLFKLSFFVFALIAVATIYGAVTLSKSFQVEFSSSSVLDRAKIENSFQNMSQAMIEGNASAGQVYLSDTTLTFHDLVLNDSESSITYFVDIANKGNLDAHFVTLQLSPDFESMEDSDLFQFEITYSDGTALQVGDTLKAGTVQTFMITISKKGESTKVVSIPEFSATVLYV